MTKHYFAPMEGVTGYIYRNVHHTFFDNIDKYFTPFIVPVQTKKLAPKDLRDVLPEHNVGFTVVPQILTNRAEDFIQTTEALKELGYREVNLNLGCPSRTVVSKNRGSGFLAQQDELERFLDTVFSKLDMKISIKTRIGKDAPEEFYELIELFNKYPMEELIIHPRLQTDYYKNKPNREIYKDAVRMSKNPLCYNGDIFTTHDYERFMTDFPETESVMFGRGLIANPGLSREIISHKTIDKSELRAFHDAILLDYQNVISGDRNLLFKMKELWLYMNCIFSDSAKYTKKIKKAQHLNDYINAVDCLFKECEIVDGAGYRTEQ
ncbi:MAG: tRNA-dihydrouridine synthase family protein [Clostridium sp.]